MPGYRKDSKINEYTIGNIVLPIVNFIHNYKPDCIIGCDRGGRIVALAVSIMYQKIYGKFPTCDSTIKFKRISKNDSKKITQDHIKPLVDYLLSKKRNPKIILLDEWTRTGVSFKRVKTLFKKLSNNSIEIKFGCLLGDLNSSVDVYGREYEQDEYNSNFHSQQHIIGIDYDANLQPFSTMTKEGIKFRRQMKKSIESILVNK